MPRGMRSVSMVWLALVALSAVACSDETPANCPAKPAWPEAQSTSGGTATFRGTVIDSEALCSPGASDPAGYLSFSIKAISVNCLESHARSSFVGGAEVVLMTLTPSGLKSGDSLVVSCAAEQACRDPRPDGGPPTSSELVCKKWRGGCRNFCYAERVEPASGS